VHADVRGATEYTPHERDAPSPHGRYPPGTTVPLALPNESVATQTVPSEHLLRTRALDSARRPLTHCVHFYTKGRCDRGVRCYFAHYVGPAAPSMPPRPQLQPPRGAQAEAAMSPTAVLPAPSLSPTSPTLGGAEGGPASRVVSPGLPSPTATPPYMAGGGMPLPPYHPQQHLFAGALPQTAPAIKPHSSSGMPHPATHNLVHHHHHQHHQQHQQHQHERSAARPRQQPSPPGAPSAAASFAAEQHKRRTSAGWSNSPYDAAPRSSPLSPAQPGIPTGSPATVQLPPPRFNNT